MFREIAGLGALDVQLVYFRGASEPERRMQSFGMGERSDAAGQADGQDPLRGRQDPDSAACSITRCGRPPSARSTPWCLSGIAARKSAIASGHAGRRAGQLKVPVFVFQEGCDEEAEEVFREIAKVSHGAYTLRSGKREAAGRVAEGCRGLRSGRDHRHWKRRGRLRRGCCWGRCGDYTRARVASQEGRG